MGYITTDNLARLGGIKITIDSEWHKEKTYATPLCIIVIPSLVDGFTILSNCLTFRLGSI